MKRLLYYTLIFLLFLNSCKKEDERKAVTAGVYDPTFTYHEFSPPFKVNQKLDSLTKYSFGVDSIDINLDGNFDLIISQSFGISTSETANLFPYCKLTLKNGLEVASKTENYNIGHGQTGAVDWVDTLKYNLRIDHLNNWSGTNTSRWMWVVPPTSFWGTNGCWYNLTDTEMYIGIRMKIDGKYQYGWIKVNEISREEMLFLSYALEN